MLKDILSHARAPHAPTLPAQDDGATIGLPNRSDCDGVGGGASGISALNASAPSGDPSSALAATSLDAGVALSTSGVDNFYVENLGVLTLEDERGQTPLKMARKELQHEAVDFLREVEETPYVCIALRAVAGMA